MQSTKTCTRCNLVKNFADFARRSASADGLTAACRECINLDKWAKYRSDEAERAATVSRVTRNRKAKFQLDPAYKRAFHLWGSTRKRTKIPPWVSIKDFVPVCQKAIRLGPEYELDHIIPIKGKLVSGLHVPSNLRVVLRTANQAKGNKHAT